MVFFIQVLCLIGLGCLDPGSGIQRIICCEDVRCMQSVGGIYLNEHGKILYLLKRGITMLLSYGRIST